MGARATIRVVHPTSKTPIHFYTHWNGHNVAQILAEGITAAQTAGRLSDYQYATRIIFDVMTGLSGDSTGYGICIGDEGQPGDVEYDTPSIEWITGHAQPFVIYRGLLYSATEFVDALNTKAIPSYSLL